jgi:hypothetical protein
MSHPVLEGKPNANHVCARIRTHVHSDYIIGHHHTMLGLNSGKVLSYIKMSKTSTESVGTLKLGYPLLLYEDAVLTRLSLVTW